MWLYDKSLYRLNDVKKLTLKYRSFYLSFRRIETLSKNKFTKTLALIIIPFNQDFCHSNAITNNSLKLNPIIWIWAVINGQKMSKILIVNVIDLPPIFTGRKIATCLDTFIGLDLPCPFSTFFISCKYPMVVSTYLKSLIWI